MRIVGLLPKPARLPVIVGLLSVCLVSFLSRADYVPAAFICFAVVFLLAFPWVKRAIFGRVVSSIFKPPADQQHRPKSSDSTVIDVEFREKKD